MKLSDYVSKFVSDAGVKHVFMITGGGAMHLNQSFGSNPDLECIFNHHEQASAMGAEAYFRLNNKLAVVNVTTGPGGTNAITGIHGAWTDSIGMVVISGQVKRETTVKSTGLPLRQLGDQEVDIVSLVKPITKYAVMVEDPQTIRYHLEKAFHLATTGRPGPCWIDIPIDVQGSRIEPDGLQAFVPDDESVVGAVGACLEQHGRDIIERISTAKRPVVMVGTGVRLSGRHDAFLRLVNKLGVPVVTAWNAHDAIEDEHACYVGRPGTVGDRAGNFAVQHADVLVILGCRLNIRQISYNWKSFAPKAYKIWVDIDEVELRKKTVNADMPIHANLAKLLPVLEHACDSMWRRTEAHGHWLEWCKERKKRYPVVLQDYWDNQEINPYCFVNQLFTQLEEGDVTVTGNGSACVVGFQAAIIKSGQRLWSNSGSASMGYDLPAAIGACKAHGNKRVICLAGDGSIMMNLQELQTISGYGLPIKIFILNNSGYISIRQTHQNFFNGNVVGSDPESGVSLPNFDKLADAFGIPYVRCNMPGEMGEAIDRTLKQDGPAICEVILSKDYNFAPKLTSKQLSDGSFVTPPLEDMAPFLPHDEMLQNNPDKA